MLTNIVSPHPQNIFQDDLSIIKIGMSMNNINVPEKPTKTKITPSTSNSNVPDSIIKYSLAYNVDTNMMISIAGCESGFRPNAVNGPYAGIFQFNSSTWRSNRIAMGEDPNPDLRFSANESAKTAAFKMARDGFGAWPSCSKKAFTQLSNL